MLAAPARAALHWRNEILARHVPRGVATSSTTFRFPSLRFSDLHQAKKYWMSTARTPTKRHRQGF